MVCSYQAKSVEDRFTAVAVVSVPAIASDRRWVPFSPLFSGRCVKATECEADYIFAVCIDGCETLALYLQSRLLLCWCGVSRGYAHRPTAENVSRVHTPGLLLKGQ
jgi:hypothetical protein